MKRKISHLSLAVLLTGGVVLASGTTNKAAAAPASKHTTHSKKFLGFSSGVECDSSGGAGIVYRFLGICIGRGDTVPGSSLCQ